LVKRLDLTVDPPPDLALEIDDVRHALIKYLSGLPELGNLIGEIKLTCCKMEAT